MDFEYFCGRCETAIARWDFTAPPDYYRCYVCGLATPFKDLPRRNVLKSWASVPSIPPFISLGTGQFDGTQVMTIPGVSVSPGSTLVIPVMRNDANETSITSVTWQSLTETVPDENIQQNVFGAIKLDVFSFKGVSGSGTVSVNMSGFPLGSIVHAIQVTGKTSLDKTASAVSLSVNPASGPSAALAEDGEAAVGSLLLVGDPNSSDNSWLNGFTSLSRSSVTSSGFDMALYTGQKTVSGVSSQNAAYHTLSASRRWDMVLTTYKT